MANLILYAGMALFVLAVVFAFFAVKKGNNIQRYGKNYKRTTSNHSNRSSDDEF